MSLCALELRDIEAVSDSDSASALGPYGVVDGLRHLGPVNDCLLWVKISTFGRGN